MYSNSICIAHGGDISDPCGGTNRVIAFVKSLHNNGLDIHLVVPRPKKDFLEDLQDVKIYTVPIKEAGIKSQPARALLVSLKAKKIAKKNNAILHVEHSTLAGFATLIGCSDFVLDMHDLSDDDPQYLNLPFSNIVQKFICNFEKRAVNNASKIIVVSNPMKETIINKWAIPEEKIVVIPNGYFGDKFKNFNLDDVEETDGMISFLGSLGPKVDSDKIINLTKLQKNLKIYVIGDGPIRGGLEEKINKNGIKNIIFTGRLPYAEALELVAKSKVVIAPYLPSKSLDVSCPVKLFDYAALGKAIVADELSEICKLFKDNDAALVSDPTNPDEFVGNVHRLLEDKKLRKKLGENAKKLVKDYTWEKQGDKLVKLYED